MNTQLITPQTSPKVAKEGRAHHQSVKDNKAQTEKANQNPARMAEAKEKKSSPEVKSEVGPIAEYMRVIARLEAKVMSGDMEQTDLNKALEMLEARLLDLPAQQKNRLLQLSFFKKFQIENLSDLKKTLVELLDQPNNRQEAFDLLRNPQMIQSLDPNLEGLKPSYGPNATNRSYASLR